MSVPATPKASTPKAGTPKAATPTAATPKVATPKAVTPKAATPKAATPKAATPSDVVVAEPQAQKRVRVRATKSAVGAAVDADAGAAEQDAAVAAERRIVKPVQRFEELSGMAGNPKRRRGSKAPVLNKVVAEVLAAQADADKVAAAEAKAKEKANAKSRQAKVAPKLKSGQPKSKKQRLCKKCDTLIQLHLSRVAYKSNV